MLLSRFQKLVAELVLLATLQDYAAFISGAGHLLMEGLHSGTPNGQLSEGQAEAFFQVQFSVWIFIKRARGRFI